MNAGYFRDHLRNAVLQAINAVPQSLELVSAFVMGSGLSRDQFSQLVAGFLGHGIHDLADDVVEPDNEPPAEPADD